MQAFAQLPRTKGPTHHSLAFPDAQAHRAPGQSPQSCRRPDHHEANPAAMNDLTYLAFCLVAYSALPVSSYPKLTQATAQHPSDHHNQEEI
ncbi:hypothetical protein EMIT0P2_90132 [Pseudomonas sp. IT-P2]